MNVKNNTYIGKYLLYNLFSNVVTSNRQDIMKADSGASKTYLKSAHKIYLQAMQTIKHGPRAILPNNEAIQANLQGNLPLHRDLNPQALVFLNLESESLLSIGQVCDDGCIALFDEKTLKVYKYDTEIRNFLQEKKQKN